MVLNVKGLISRTRNVGCLIGRVNVFAKNSLCVGANVGSMKMFGKRIYQQDSFLSSLAGMSQGCCWAERASSRCYAAPSRLSNDSPLSVR